MILFLITFTPCALLAEFNQEDLSVSGYVRGIYLNQENGVLNSTDTFTLREVALRADYTFNTYFYASLEFDLKSDQIWEAYLEALYPDNYGVKFGQFIIPFGIEVVRRGFQTKTIDRPLGLQELFFDYYNARDIGVAASAKYKYLITDISFVNGSGWENRDDDAKKTTAGRLLFSVKNFIFGGSFYDGSYFDEYSRDRDRFGASLIIKGEFDTLEVEWYRGEDDKIKSEGWYVQGGMGVPLLSPQALHYVPIRGLFRFEQWDPNRKLERDKISILTFGLEYKPYNFLAVQLNYEIHQEEVKEAEIDNDIFLAQIQIVF
ncbi:MAG: hypothetical protein ABII27_03245 [bacterium]